MNGTFSDGLRGTAKSVLMLPRRGLFNKGNSREYAAASCPRQEHSSLRGKRICFLGSSVTYGFAARGESFVDYLAAQDGVVAFKYAVNGTTLGGTDPQSYVSRLHRIDIKESFDLFVCQLSTNDSSFGVPLGSISSSKKPEDFDIGTTIGAMEHILAYVEDTWGCPAAFFTCPRYPSAPYQKLVTQLYGLRDKWGFEILDLWQDTKIAESICRSRDIFMTDDIHPTRACYQKLWTPFFRKRLKEILPEAPQKTQSEL